MSKMIAPPVSPRAVSPEDLERHERYMETQDLKSDLLQSSVWQFRMIIELFKLLKQSTLINNTDVDPVILSKAQAWITKLDRLKEIDE